MIVTPIKTKPITEQQSLTELIDTYIPSIADNSIVVITSKIVSICEGRIVPVETTNKDTLIAEESQWYIPRTSSKYNVMLTINADIMIASAGIDESNANNHYVLWPKNPYQTATTVWNHLKEKHSIHNLGIIITDSRNTPTRWGTIGIGLAFCGFEPLKDYVGTPDIFGRLLKMQKSSILDGLAATAVVAMGEGNEQTPLAVIKDPINVIYMNRPPTPEEITALQIEKEDDLYEPMLTKAPWLKGGQD